MQDTEDLATFVRKVIEEKELTAREVERRSGGEITHSYVNKIKNGTATNPSPALLKALAKGLGVAPDVLFAIVQGKSLDEKETLQVMDFNGFDTEDLREIREFIEFKRAQKKRKK